MKWISKYLYRSTLTEYFNAYVSFPCFSPPYFLIFFAFKNLLFFLETRVKCLFARFLVISANIKSNNTTRLKHTYGTRVAVTDVLVNNKTLNYFQIAEINIGCTEHDLEHTYRNNKTKKQIWRYAAKCQSTQSKYFYCFYR